MKLSEEIADESQNNIKTNHSQPQSVIKKIDSRHNPIVQKLADQLADEHIKNTGVAPSKKQIANQIDRLHPNKYGKEVERTFSKTWKKNNKNI